MSTRLIVMNYMRGSGGEYIMNLLGGAQERSHKFETFNKFGWSDSVPYLSIIFDVWGDAISNGYNDLYEYLFHTKYNKSSADTEKFITTYLPTIKEHSFKTLNDYCSYVCENLPRDNKINGVCSHYKHPNIRPIKTFLPCAWSIGLSTSGVDLNYFRFLCVVKKLNSSPGKPMAKKDFLVLFEDDMFFNKECVFNGNTNSDFVIDAQRLFFNFEDYQLHQLSSFLRLKPTFNKYDIEEYTNKNMALLKQHLDYSYGQPISDNDAREMFLNYIDWFYAQNSS